MKQLIATLAIVAAIAFTAPAAEVAKEIKSRAWLADVSLEPYGTVSWQGLDGKAVLGAGANIVTHITKGFSLWGFGESDNTQHSTIDRAGLGLRYEGNLGKHVKGDAGFAGAYDTEATAAFLRLETGLTISLIQTKSFDAGLRGAYAFDISGDGKHGTADGRAFFGPVATLKW